MLGTPNLKVYLKEVSNLDWGSGALDWTTASTGATLVFNGNPAPLVGTGGGWKQIPFTANFSYSGTQNLAIFIEYNNPSASNAISWSYEFTSPCVSGSSTGLETKYNNNTTGTFATSLTSTNSRRPYIGFDYVVTCPAPTNISINNINATSATATWTPGGSETSWEYATVPAGSPAPTAFTTTNTPNATLSLNPSTNYDFYVKAKCGGTNGDSILKGPYNFITLCSPMTSMFENFDSYATGSIVPICWDRIIGSTNGNQTISSSTPASGTRNIYQYASSAANGTIVVLPTFSNVNAGTHWLRFKARVSSGTGNLDVGYVTNATDASTFVTLQSLSISNTTYTVANSEYNISVPNTVPANARLAIRNYGSPTATIYWDDVYWEPAPTCFPPSNVTVSAITQNSATIGWTAASPVPSSGYQVYYSTSNIAPTSSTVLNASNSTTTTSTPANISSLTPSSSYYVWVRSNCGSGDYSAWTAVVVQFNTLCQPPALISATGATVCPGNTAILNATADTGASVKWYDVATGGSPIATGNSYTTPPLTATTTYWVSATNGTQGNVGKVAPEANASGTGGGLTSYITFTALSDFTLKSVDLYPYSSTAGTAGTATIELRSSAGTPITSTTVNVIGNNSPSAAPQTATLNFPIAAGASYRLGVSAWTGISNMYRDESNLSFPYSLPGVVNITGTNLSTTYFYFFYNWKVETGCESARTMVTATVDAAGCLATAEVAQKENFKIYPNPFTDFINIQNVDKVKSISVIDATGRVVKSNIKVSETINLSDLKSGMYLLNLELKDGSKVSHKIMKK